MPLPKKTEVRAALTDIRGYARSVERALKHDDWQQVDCWLTAIAGHAGLLQDRIERYHMEEDA
jgi:hypothetical protein